MWRPGGVRYGHRALQPGARAGGLRLRPAAGAVGLALVLSSLPDYFGVVLGTRDRPRSLCWLARQDFYLPNEL